jgi:hypothetical protein
MWREKALQQIIAIVIFCSILGSISLYLMPRHQVLFVFLFCLLAVTTLIRVANSAYHAMKVIQSFKHSRFHPPRLGWLRHQRASFLMAYCEATQLHVPPAECLDWGVRAFQKEIQYGRSENSCSQMTSSKTSDFFQWRLYLFLLPILILFAIADTLLKNNFDIGSLGRTSIVAVMVLTAALAAFFITRRRYQESGADAFIDGQVLRMSKKNGSKEIALCEIAELGVIHNVCTLRLKSDERLKFECANILPLVRALAEGGHVPTINAHWLRFLWLLFCVTSEAEDVRGRVGLPACE